MTTPTTWTAVSALSTLSAATATHVYGVENATGEGKVPIGGATGLLSVAAATTLLALKAPLASPTFTGVPAAPTAAVETKTTQLATTAFVYSNATLAVASDPGPVTPATGATVTLTPYGAVAVWPINPAGTLADLTIGLADGSATDGGNVVFAAFSKAITALAYDGTNITATGGLPLPTTVAANTTLGFVWTTGTSKWTRFL